MLRKDRDERYQTAKELLADLRRVKERLHAPTQIPPAPSLASEAPSTLRGRAARRVAVPLVAALLGLAAVTSWMSRPSPSAAIPEPRLGELVRFDARTRSWAPYLSGMSAHHLDFSPDGQWIAYVDYPEGTLCRSRSDGSGRTQLTFPPLRAATPRWSPDGTRIVFVAALPDKPWKIHMVAPERSPARPLSTEDREERTPGWSPDGRKIVFWVTGDKKDDRLIRILDLVTHRESAVPGSEGKYSARWSPDGRSLLALRFADNSLSVFDLGKGRWTELAGPDLSWPQWSRDGRHIYVQTIDGATVFRVALADRRVEPWASLKVVPRVSRLEPFGYWMGLTPDDSPLVLAKWGASLKGHTAAPPAP